MGAMPVGWEIRGPVLVLTVSGDYQFAEMKQAVAEALVHRDFRPGMSLLLDGRRSESKLTGNEVRSRAEWVASLGRSGFSSRSAVVIPPLPHRFGLARMAAANIQLLGAEMRIFQNMEEALRWLAPSGT